MVNYELNKNNFTADQTKLIDTFCAKCSEVAKNMVNSDNFKHLKLTISYTIKKRSFFDLENTKYNIVSNADFSISSSYDFLQKFSDYITKQADFGTFDNAFLEIKIVFQERTQIKDTLSTFNENKKPDKMEKKDDALPTFLPIDPKYTFDQCILPETVKSEIMNALSLIKHRDLIYNKWGFGKIDPSPRSILNFYGPPGTGKSMCAHAIASELKQPLLALNYADIESKYVGEAAKNLKKAFDCAKELNAVMFFDEADSFLGKRIENVTTGSDQALNSLRSQMLIYLESFSGVILFATNLVTNFDKAFESRILSHIKFELPNREARAAIIRKMLPQDLPIDNTITDENLLEASDIIDGLSGREIKNAIQSMLLNEAQAHGENAVFTFDILKKSLEDKKTSLDKLKTAENERIKSKIARKLKEKAMEEEAEESQKSAVKEDDDKNINTTPDATDERT